MPVLCQLLSLATCDKLHGLCYLPSLNGVQMNLLLHEKDGRIYQAPFWIYIVPDIYIHAHTYIYHCLALNCASAVPLNGL
ncbi:hypothetical protein GDO81_007701 [Engystomops pustulosus]|uniref:Uncharacterized protein n=1 Tax=Engystomops pustulosus TaxID=76066 RepID=A0AAV7C984_ENGPU|nr:hypothetical protein GDO81_007701 [Engystomops pustulosus]